MKYRIKQIDMIGYFAQVKRHWFSGWKTIGKHANDQVGEYPENHTDYPLSCQSEAVKLCHRHAKFNKAKHGFTSYRDIML